MGQEIVVVQQMGDALRNTGYKNIECAVSEIIDNSIEAEAKNVFILIEESIDENTGAKYVSEIGFLDDGVGMEHNILASCLGIGCTTRSKRNGMGRFGVGLPQSSLYACPSVDVYSWQDGYDLCEKVYLDINMVSEGIQTEIEDPVLAKLPSKFAFYLQYNTIFEHYDFSKSGTFVHWKNCDRISPKTRSFLLPRLQFALGQKFRHLIADGTQNIKIIPIEDPDNSIDVMPNDPLFLMKNNYVLGNPDAPSTFFPQINENCIEPLFTSFTNEQCTDGIVKVPVKYREKGTGVIKESIVTIAFSKIRDLFYDLGAFPAGINPGSSKMGKHVAKMEGISIVRAGREIDFGQFDFYENINKPEHRWWGCEISFMPELDEAFGVANNKQHVELMKLNPEDYINEEIQPIYLQLYSIVHNTIDKMYAENKVMRANSRSADDIKSPATDIVNHVEEGNDDEGESAEVKNNTPIENLIDKGKEELAAQGIEEPTDEEATTYITNKVNIIYADLGRGLFFDYDFSLGTVNIRINTSHIFYTTFFNEIAKVPETKVAFELFIAALVKAIDATNLQQGEANDNLIQEWNVKLRKYISELNNPTK